MMHSIWARSLSVFAVIFLMATQASVAGVYEYYPGSVLRLGGTFNPENLTASYPTCIDYKKEYAVHILNREHDAANDKALGPQANVAAQNELSIEQIKTREHLYQFLDQSVSISGHYGFFGASASVHSQNEETFDSDSFVFGVRGKTTFAEVGLVGPTLNSEARALVKNPAAFFARCGREWVTQESRGVLIAVVYTIKNVSKSQRSLLEAAVSGGYNSPGLGIDVSANMTKILQSAFTSNFYSVQIHFIGGKGVSEFANTITNMDDPMVVLKSIADYLKTLNYSNSVPLRFSTGPLDQFLAQNNPNGLFDSVNRRIGNLYLEYEDYRAERANVWRFLHEDIQSTWGAGLDDKAWARVDELDKVLGTIEERAQSCRSAAQYAAEFTAVGKSDRQLDDPRKEFVAAFAIGISENLANETKDLSKATGNDHRKDRKVGAAQDSLSRCLSDDGTAIKSRFPVSAVPHIEALYDSTLSPRTILYVSVTSAARLTKAELVDNGGAKVANLQGGYDPVQGPVWFGSVLFCDGAGNFPPPDKLPYVVRVVDGLGRIFVKPIVPLN